MIRRIIGPCALAVMVLTTQAEAAPFTPGNLVVVRVGDGVGTLGVSAAPVFLVEYTPAGLAAQTIALPTGVSGTQRRLVLAGSTGNSEGTLSRSGDGRFVTLAGYDTDVGTTVSSTSAALVNRIVARVDSCGRVNTATAITDFPTGNSAPIRAAVTNDGTGYWFVGGGSVTGVRWTLQGAQGATAQVAAIPGNARVVRIFGGQLYVSAGASNFLGMGPVGAGLPTVPGQDSTLFAGLINSSIYDFARPEPSLLYVADDSATTPGLSRYTYYAVCDCWDRNYATTAGLTPGGVALRRLCARAEGSGHGVYALTDDGLSLVRLFDDGVGVPAFTTIATAPAGTRFRGLDFAPEGTCCPADMDDGSGTGTPDGGVDINDLLYFLGEYEAGTTGADLDDGSGTGTPDGGVDINDLLFFLTRYEGGC